MNAILRPVHDCLITLVYGLLAFILGGALVWQFGTSWLARVVAAVVAAGLFRIACLLTFDTEDRDGRP